MSSFAFVLLVSDGSLLHLCVNNHTSVNQFTLGVRHVFIEYNAIYEDNQELESLSVLCPSPPSPYLRHASILNIRGS